MHFLRGSETFLGFGGFHRQANTRPASRPPSDLPVPLKGDNGRARDDLARLSRFFWVVSRRRSFLSSFASGENLNSNLLRLHHGKLGRSMLRPYKGQSCRVVKILRVKF